MSCLFEPVPFCFAAVFGLGHLYQLAEELKDLKVPMQMDYEFVLAGRTLQSRGLVVVPHQPWGALITKMEVEQGFGPPLLLVRVKNSNNLGPISSCSCSPSHHLCYVPSIVFLCNDCLEIKVQKNSVFGIWEFYNLHGLVESGYWASISVLFHLRASTLPSTDVSCFFISKESKGACPGSFDFSPGSVGVVFYSGSIGVGIVTDAVEISK
ncbi:hypothetical protein SLE2022_265660 [Rubroshorea leprosula]